MSGGEAPAALRNYAQIAEPLLSRFLARKREELRGLPVDLSEAHRVLIDYALRGGKRIRGALVVLGHQAAGGASETVLDASLGVELLHTYLLVHDDFMDQDELRRGGTTVHATLAKRFGDHTGGSLAVLLGSLCQAWAYELILSTPVAPDRALAAGKLLSCRLQEVTVGQMLDLAAPFGPELPAGAVLEIERLKTGSYTFDLPLRLGALLGGAENALLARLSNFARPLGQAFQIADDLLGTFGAPEVTGKPNASDLRQGKRTLLVTRASESAPAAEAARLRQAAGTRDLSDSEIADLRAIIVRSGAAEAVRAEAEKLCAEALRALDSAEIPAAVADALREIAVYAVRRAL